MKNRKLKIAFEFIFMIILILSFSQTVFGWTPNWNSLEGQSGGNTETAVYSIMGKTINIVSIIGAGIAIIMLIWMAIKYMNTYHPVDKAEMKKQLPAYITGAIILFSASALLKIIQMFSENINNIGG